MADPAEDPTHRGTVVDGVRVVGALSPSRASDFKSCALRYRFRTVDRLREPPSREALRGTVVHKVLEDLFDVPAPGRTREQAAALVGPSWAAVAEAEELATDLFGSPDDEAAWLASCRTVLDRYFDLEDPRRLEPAEREAYVETLLASRLLLHGVVDRVDVAPDGAVRVVDYKTARAVPEGLEATALFQMRFYALVLWRSRGTVPAMLRLIYLGDGTTISYAPDEADLRATERQLEALWSAIALAHETGEWLPRRSARCTWCSFQDLCPEFGGTPPPIPQASGSRSGPGLREERAEPVHVDGRE
jgi:putative RecB family exonuclease